MLTNLKNANIKVSSWQSRCPPGGGSMAQTFMNSNIQSGKVVVFIKPTCPYSRRTQELLSQLSFKQGLLGFFDITDNGDTNEIQDYLQQLTGARTVPRVFIGKECIGGCTDLVNMHERGELLRQLKQTGTLL
ncbi:glutaredoxin-1-like [Cervus canadensis]|uniref:glutaredoxin-1-like n=2 Tax=Cervus TaxID=9859 RepID=UPI001CA35B85|nr:glutaredoxin-1-like [Cervus canadensis]